MLQMPTVFFSAFDSSLGFPGEGPGFGFTAPFQLTWLGLGLTASLLQPHALFGPPLASLEFELWTWGAGGRCCSG